MTQEEMILALDISNVTGDDYTSFMRWIYERHENVIEERCGNCKKDCPYNSIEGLIHCVIGFLNYSDLYQRFKKSE